MKTLLPVLLWALLPGVVAGQSLGSPVSPSVSVRAQSRTAEDTGEPGTEGPALDSSEAFSRSWSSAALGLTERENATPLFNTTTLAVLLANCPKDMPEDEWLKMMQEPVNQALFPLRVTQGMLDTLDGREMDLRFRYVLVGEW